ncbi:MAG: hypothetical protein OHK0029_38380 [Armatimonadaceae bacterium]
MVKAAIVVAAVLIAGSATWAQGTKVDYARALGLRQQTEGKVFRAEVRANWLPGNARFWYRNDLPEGRAEFVLVDAEKAEKKPAFDHGRLAAALSKTLNRAVDPEKLPVERIAFPAPGSMVVQTGLKTFLCDLATYYLVESKDALGQLEARHPSEVRVSGGNGAETFITFANRMAAPVRLYWITPEGEKREYGVLPPGETKKQHTFENHAWLTAAEDGKPLGVFVATANPGLAVVRGTVPEPRRRPRPRSNVSPNGKWQIVFRNHNAFLQTVGEAGETPLTTDGTKDDSYGGGALWSPNGTRVVVTRSVPAEEHKVYLVESSPKDQVQPRLKTIDYLKPGDRVSRERPRLFDVSSRREIPIAEDLFPNPWDISRIRWDADGKRFTFLYNQRGHQVLRLIGVDAETGEARTLINEESKTFLCYSSKTFLHLMDQTKEAVWMSERDGWNHLYLYDTATGKVKNQITQGPWVVRSVDRVDEEKRQIWFRAGGIVPGQDPYYIHYCRINFDGTGLTLLTEGDGTHSLSFSPDGQFYVDTYSRVDMPPVSELRRTQDGKKVLNLERGDAEALVATGWKYPERFVAKGRDDKTDIYGVIWRPTNFDPAKSYPIIEQIYAGPHSAHVPKSFSSYHGAQSLAELGFIVVMIDGMGTNWRSKAFHDVCWQNLADAGFPDRILWIKAAASRYPYMDTNRVGIYGTSAGGQNALGGMLLHPEFYRVGVSDCGCHDNRMDKIWWNEQWMGYPVGPHYEASSNVTLAPNLQGKLLLMVGELDTNVDPASTVQVVNALIKADRDFDYLFFPGGGHGILGTEYGKRRMWDFFVRHLHSVEPRR